MFSITFGLTSWADLAIDDATIVYLRRLFIIVLVIIVAWAQGTIHANGSWINAQNIFCFGVFSCIFRENYEFHVIIYTPLSIVLRLGMVFFCMLQVFKRN